MTATPTLEARLAKLLPCDDCYDPEQAEPCALRPAILTLLRTLLREERERCASQWREVYEIPMRDRIRALEDRND